MLTPFLNPWVLLAGLLVILGAFGAGYASNDGAETVQAAWDRANQSAWTARQKRIDDARASQDRLQQAAEDARREKHERERVLTARIDALAGELRQRPTRPASGGGGAVSPVAGPGPANRGCTGADLYRDDAELLARIAATAVRVKSERDQCYAQYRRAQDAVNRLNGAATPEAPAAGR